MLSIADFKAQCECGLPTLRLGSKGDDVKFLQEILNSYGYSLKVDGDFGKLTEAAVKKFQKSHGLVEDGIVGEKTWNALLPDEPSKYPILRRGSTGYYVTLLQDRLNVIGYPLKSDGIFGEKTEAAVKSFQKAQGLVVDGIVGKYTWTALYAID